MQSNAPYLSFYAVVTYRLLKTLISNLHVHWHRLRIHTVSIVSICLNTLVLNAAIVVNERSTKLCSMLMYVTVPLWVNGSKFPQQELLSVFYVKPAGLTVGSQRHQLKIFSWSVMDPEPTRRISTVIRAVRLFNTSWIQTHTHTCTHAHANASIVEIWFTANTCEGYYVNSYYTVLSCICGSMVWPGGTRIPLHVCTTGPDLDYQTYRASVTL